MAVSRRLGNLKLHNAGNPATQLIRLLTAVAGAATTNLARQQYRRVLLESLGFQLIRLLAPVKFSFHKISRRTFVISGRFQSFFAMTTVAISFWPLLTSLVVISHHDAILRCIDLLNSSLKNRLRQISSGYKSHPHYYLSVTTIPHIFHST